MKRAHPEESGDAAIALPTKRARCDDDELSSPLMALPTELRVYLAEEHVRLGDLLTLLDVCREWRGVAKRAIAEMCLRNEEMASHYHSFIQHCGHVYDGSLRPHLKPVPHCRIELSIWDESRWGYTLGTASPSDTWTIPLPSDRYFGACAKCGKWRRKADVQRCAKSASCRNYQDEIPDGAWI